jgi:expansin (peptidoglycan-binding protein)
MFARLVCGLSLALLALGCSSSDDDADAPKAGTGHAATCAAETEHEGEATYYDLADGGGACSFEPTPDDLMVAAMNAPDYAGSAACGSCAEVNGPDGMITVRVVDLCPECPAGNLDLSPSAFERIAALDLGRVPISWRYVPCAVSGALSYHFKDGSNQWWTAVQVRNHRHAIARFEYEKDGAFVEVPREGYNYFVETAGMGPGPYTFRVTDVYGGTATDSGVVLGDNVTQSGSSALPECAP